MVIVCENCNLIWTRGSELQFESGRMTIFRLNNYRQLYSTNVSNALNAGQVAFANRLGIDKLPTSKLISALSHPKLNKLTSDSSEFDKLVQIGGQSLTIFTREYLKSRFPVLKEKYLEIGMKMFLAEKNLLGLAKFLGIQAACGIDLLQARSSKRMGSRNKRKQIENQDENSLDFDEIELQCFKAILGLIGTEGGPKSLRTFLDSRYFNNSLFNPKDLVCPLYPIPDLTQLYPNLVFRLHQESGRLSSYSMFIVGVYADKAADTFLGEGYGASQALAQHRAATEALRKLYLVEKRVGSRPSDDISSASALLSNAL